MVFSVRSEGVGRRVTWIGFVALEVAHERAKTELVDDAKGLAEVVISLLLLPLVHERYFFGFPLGLHIKFKRTVRL